MSPEIEYNMGDVHNIWNTYAIQNEVRFNIDMDGALKISIKVAYITGRMPTGTARVTTLAIPTLGINQEIQLGKFEIKTLRVNIAVKKLDEAGLMED